MTSHTLISTLLQVINVYIRNIKRHVGIINPEMLFPNESMPNCDFDTRLVAVKKSGVITDITVGYYTLINTAPVTTVRK